MTYRRQPGDADLAIDFGNRLRELRHELGISQEKLAEHANLSRAFVGHLEQGASSPTLATIVRLAAALERDPADLVRGLAIDS